ncbi:MAG: MucR family transcriptional regulator [Dongiaceae bacterium]
MSQQANPADLLPLVSEIVAAHLSNNQVPQADLPALIREVYQALAAVGGVVPAAPERARPAVPVARSVGQNEIACLACGEKMKMLKRHLRTAHAMTPRQYRDTFGLDADYPLVAPAYAKKRSKLAKSIGLGRPLAGRRGRR